MAITPNRSVNQEAKILRRAVRAGDPAAIARIRAVWHDCAEKSDEAIATGCSLRRCLHVVSREAGGRSYLDVKGSHGPVSLTALADRLRRGEMVAITGKSGCGKSFLGRRLLVHLMRRAECPPIVIVNLNPFQGEGEAPDSYQPFLLAARQVGIRAAVVAQVTPALAIQVLDMPFRPEAVGELPGVLKRSFNRPPLVVLDCTLGADAAIDRQMVGFLQACHAAKMPTLTIGQDHSYLMPMDQWTVPGHLVYGTYAGERLGGGIPVDDVFYLRKLSRGQFLCRTGVGGSVSSLVPLNVPLVTPLEYWIATESGPDVHARMSLLNAKDGLTDEWESILEAAERWPHGVQGPPKPKGTYEERMANLEDTGRMEAPVTIAGMIDRLSRWSPNLRSLAHRCAAGLAAEDTRGFRAVVQAAHADPATSEGDRELLGTMMWKLYLMSLPSLRQGSFDDERFHIDQAIDGPAMMQAFKASLSIDRVNPSSKW